jgi:hypothetical protein
MVTQRDYTSEAVNAARSVLIELMHLLGEYREHIVLIGGWVPEIMLSNQESPHTGSMDVDLALDHRKIQAEVYETIRKLLLKRGYQQGAQPFIFHRRVTIGGRELDVQVDLLAGEYGGTGKSRRHQRVQNGHARKARGCDLAFENYTEVTVTGELPAGGRDTVTFRVAGIVPFLVMKGMALDSRLKEKDAWDIYYCLLNFPGGLNALVREFKPLAGHGLVREGLEKIAKHFATETHVGPKLVADFEEVTADEAREILQRDAYERVNYLLQELGIK